MARWAIFLRGVNVGGHGKLPMADLRRALTGIGAENVATYIQSGNIVMDHPDQAPTDIAASVSDLVEAEFGFRPDAVALSPDALDDLIAAIPQPETVDAKNIHVYLCDGAPPTGLASHLARYCTQGEEILALPRAVVVLAPNGIGRSKLAAPLDRHLKNSATARNLNSLRKVQALLKGQSR
ncbi:DUF1697 domain-containing protein [Thalassovita aquimarina]|uniref:DUF1697 domain-containing protein n=1 Tax=Thalassovita aquimarina TaxID=2785917 RepID=A0ABS5HN11_9RHOB|nr:DUF1697 domain-containing protein [Thalassovita aquimarina]